MKTQRKTVDSAPTLLSTAKSTSDLEDELRAYEEAHAPVQKVTSAKGVDKTNLRFVYRTAREVSNRRATEIETQSKKRGQRLWAKAQAVFDASTDVRRQQWLCTVLQANSQLHRIQKITRERLADAFPSPKHLWLVVESGLKSLEGFETKTDDESYQNEVKNFRECLDNIADLTKQLTFKRNHALRHLSKMWRVAEKESKHVELEADLINLVATGMAEDDDLDSDPSTTQTHRLKAQLKKISTQTSGQSHRLGSKHKKASGAPTAEEAEKLQPPTLLHTGKTITKEILEMCKSLLTSLRALDIKFKNDNPAELLSLPRSWFDLLDCMHQLCKPGKEASESTGESEGTEGSQEKEDAEIKEWKRTSCSERFSFFVDTIRAELDNPNGVNHARKKVSVVDVLSGFDSESRSVGNQLHQPRKSQRKSFSTWAQPQLHGKGSKEESSDDKEIEELLPDPKKNSLQEGIKELIQRASSSSVRSTLSSSLNRHLASIRKHTEIILAGCYDDEELKEEMQEEMQEYSKKHDSDARAEMARERARERAGSIHARKSRSSRKSELTIIDEVIPEHHGSIRKQGELVGMGAPATRATINELNLLNILPSETPGQEPPKRKTADGLPASSDITHESSHDASRRLSAASEKEEAVKEGESANKGSTSVSTPFAKVDSVNNSVTLLNKRMRSHNHADEGRSHNHADEGRSHNHVDDRSHNHVDEGRSHDHADQVRSHDQGDEDNLESSHKITQQSTAEPIADGSLLGTSLQMSMVSQAVHKVKVHVQADLKPDAWQPVSSPRPDLMLNTMLFQDGPGRLPEIPGTAPTLRPRLPAPTTPRAGTSPSKSRTARQRRFVPSGLHDNEITVEQIYKERGEIRADMEEHFPGHNFQTASSASLMTANHTSSTTSLSTINNLASTTSLGNANLASFASLPRTFRALKLDSSYASLVSSTHTQISSEPKIWTSAALQMLVEADDDASPSVKSVVAPLSQSQSHRSFKKLRQTTTTPLTNDSDMYAEKKENGSFSTSSSHTFFRQGSPFAEKPDTVERRLMSNSSSVRHGIVCSAGASDCAGDRHNSKPAASLTTSAEGFMPRKLHRIGNLELQRSLRAQTRREQNNGQSGKKGLRSAHEVFPYLTEDHTKETSKETPWPQAAEELALAAAAGQQAFQ